MKPIIVLALLLFAGYSCKKEMQKSEIFSGVWVESSLRLDTLDFESANLIDYAGENDPVFFQTNTYSDPVLNPSFPVNHSSLYDYYFNKGMDRIYLRSFLSSSSAHNSYRIQLSDDQKRFTAEKFYPRRALPDVIEFVRIR
jgi:hypothetical protein